LCRQQGLAILINIFFGTIYNAAYGIANQIYGSLSFIITSITNAMNPQIMKAEGNHERDKMLSLACKESKFIVAIMALVFIPLIFEMDNVLKLWLKDVPTYTCFFCQCIFIAFLIDQTTQGLHSAVQAIGQIRNYTLLMYTPKLLSLFFFWYILQYDGSLEKLEFNSENLFIGCQGCTMCFRREFLEKIRSYWYEGWAHDEFVWKLSLAMDGLYFYHKKTLKRRLHSNNVTLHKMRDVQKRIRFLEDLKKSHNATLSFITDNGGNKKRQKLLVRNIKATDLRISLLKDRKYFNTVPLLLFYFDCYHKSRSIPVELYMAIKQ